MNDTAAVKTPLPFGDASVADIVAQLNELDADEASSLLARLPFDTAVDVLDRPELTRCGELLLALPGELAGRILKGMSADRAAAALRQLDGYDRTRLLAQVDFETAMQLKLLLAYPQGTAGSIMTTEFVAVPSTWTVSSRTVAMSFGVDTLRSTAGAGRCARGCFSPPQPAAKAARQATRSTDRAYMGTQSG